MANMSKVHGACPECGSGKFFIANNRSYCSACGYYN